MSAAISCLAVCVCDVTNKASVCGTRVLLRHEQSLSAFLLTECEPTWLRREEVKLETQTDKEASSQYALTIPHRICPDITVLVDCAQNTKLLTYSLTGQFI